MGGVNFSKTRGFLSSKPTGGGPCTPERYLELTRTYMVQVEKNMTARKFNFEQCKHLAAKLKLAVESADSFLELFNKGHSILYLEEDMKICLERSCRPLFALAMAVENFIESCCTDRWIQSAFTLTNVAEHILSLSFDLKLWTLLYSDIKPSSACRSRRWTQEELDGFFKAEAETVEEKAALDREILLRDLSFVLQSEDSSNTDRELAVYMKDLLERFESSKTRCGKKRLVAASDLPKLSDSRLFETVKRIKQIGRGSFGTVHEANWLGSKLAMKTFDGYNNPDFGKEVSVLIGLSHPNIVSLMGYKAKKHNSSIFMELLDKSLRSLMNERLDDGSLGRSTPFDILEAVDIMLQIGEGMHYVHEMRIVHRDLKSDNILVRCLRKPELHFELVVAAKVADFGLSKTKEKSVTYSNQTPNMGSYRWMAPEMIKFSSAEREKEKAEGESMILNYPFKSDMYSFALVCYEILTGNPPFPTIHEPTKIKNMVLNGNRPELPEGCPLPLKTLIERCWSQDASERPSFCEICVELRHLKCSLLVPSIVEKASPALNNPLQPLTRHVNAPEIEVFAKVSPAANNPVQPSTKRVRGDEIEDWQLSSAASQVIRADPHFSPALVGAAVSLFFSEVINAAKSAYGHKKKCKLVLESVNKLQPHIDAACSYSANWEKAQTDALTEIKGILDTARSFAEKGATESKSERQKRAMAFWRWGKLPADLMGIIHRIEEANQNVILCAALKTLEDENTQTKTKLLTFVPQQIQSDRIVGVDEPFNRLKASILKARHDQGTASHLGLHGRGGAGKTLLAQMLHNDKDIVEAYGSASAVIWITVGLDARVADLYKTMATFLQDGGTFEKDYGHRSLQDQRTYLWNAFAEQKVFLVLDDVWQESCEDRHEMMYWLNIATGPGSATLITTRNSEVLSKVYAESEVVLCLSEEDSWRLFCSYAFRNGIPPATVPEDLAKEVCGECKGLPLALKVVGSAMVDKVDMGEWSFALRNLKQSKAILGSTVDYQLFGCLRLSYDRLESDVLKTCFLYFAAFPEDYKIATTRLFNMWISEGLVDGDDEARAHLKVLEKRSLIDLGNRETYAQVHDILRDLALLIIDKARPGECGYDGYFQSGKVVKTLPAHKSLMTMRRMSFINTAIPAGLDNRQAPQLQVCLLSGIIGSDAPAQECFSNLDMPNLKYLALSSNHFDNLRLAWLPESMGELKCLAHLDLSVCRSLKQLPESMGELKCLAHLDLSRCGSLEQLPESMGELKCLAHLDLSYCGSLKQLPESMGELKCLAHLDLSDCGSLKQLPESMGELKCLAHLDLSYCESLEQLLESMGELKCLAHLDLSGCGSLKQLPESMGELKCLAHLNLHWCGSLKQLPESMGELKCLAHLDLSYCESLKQLPESMGELKCLAHLDLSGCGSLKQLPESMGELKCLAHLDLSYCESLKQLPESMGELKCLAHLDLSYCGSLKQLPKSMGELKCLAHLDLSRCGSLEQLPESMGELKCLAHLNLHGCESLKQLPESMGELKCLAHLDLSYCGSLKQLPESMGELKCLAHLDLSDYGSLKQLPENMGELKCLAH